MMFRLRRWSYFAFAGVLYLALPAAASAQVVVTVDGDTAHATISLTGDNGQNYDAEVTIDFDTPLNLSPESLNLTAELVDPAAIDGRLPPDDIPILCGGGVAINPAFPMMITVEPIDIPWLFSSGFEGGSASGGLEFLNTYTFEVHTGDLVYQPHSTYRLFKAPIGGQFADITNDVLEGSVRARGRHGAFSQFVIASDTRGHGVLPPITCEPLLGKLTELQLRIVGAILDDALRLDLLNLLAKVTTLLAVDVQAALAALDELIAEVDANAGTEIANVWRASRDVVNDAGEMEALAQTLRFSIVDLLGGGTANP
jgi:hypothetical protein